MTKHFFEKDLELQNILRRHDPAENTHDTTTLELRIASHIYAHARLQKIEALTLFPVARIMSWKMPWPMAASAVTMLGLLIGLYATMLADKPALPSYTMTAALTEPWHSFAP